MKKSSKNKKRSVYVVVAIIVILVVSNARVTTVPAINKKYDVVNLYQDYEKMVADNSKHFDHDYLNNFIDDVESKSEMQSRYFYQIGDNVIISKAYDKEGISRQDVIYVENFLRLLKSFKDNYYGADEASIVQLQYIVNEFRKGHHQNNLKVNNKINNKRIKLAYLTFDDGPSNNTLKVLDILNRYRVSGTFFFVGRNVNKVPDETFKKIKDAKSNIGMHGYSHVYANTTNLNKFQKELVRTKKVLQQRGIVTNLLRMPYGSTVTSKHNRHILAQSYYLMDWNVDSLDWKDHESKKKIMKNVIPEIKTDQDNLILLFHEDNSTLKALPDVIKYLQQRDYYIVSMNQDYFYSYHF